jgi:hypothetical protein
VNLQNTDLQDTYENVQRTSTRIKRAAAVKSLPAANQVFATTELLEQILLNNGTMKDLIRLRGVCHKFKDVIEGTRSLMQIIFLSPQDLDHEWRSLMRIDPGFPRYALTKEPKRSRNTKEEQSWFLKPARFNPLLFRQLSQYARIPIWHTGSGDRWTSEELHLREGAGIKGTKIRVGSPLLNMFATQPPVYEMSFRTGGPGSTARQIRNRKGIKVIDVLRVAEGLVGGLDGRVVVEDIIFPPEAVDAIYRQNYLDGFYACNIWW